MSRNEDFSFVLFFCSFLPFFFSFLVPSSTRSVQQKYSSLLKVKPVMATHPKVVGCDFSGDVLGVNHGKLVFLIMLFVILKRTSLQCGEAAPR